VLQCLETCDSLKASSIAFPALGAGNLKYPLKVVANIMINTIVSYLKDNCDLTCIKTVKLVIYMDDAYAQFNEVLYELSLTSPVDNQSLSQSEPIVAKPQSCTVKSDEYVTIDDSKNLNRTVSHEWISKSLPNTNNGEHFSISEYASGPMDTVSVHSKGPVLLVQIYAETLSRVKKTKDRLQRIIDDQFTTDALTDELIAKLSNEKMNAFTTKAKQKHVEISITSSPPLICIQLRGDRNDVADLKFEIQQELNQIRASESFHREAKLLQDKIKWWWWMSDTKQYKCFDFLVNYQIEQAYQTNRGSIFTVETQELLVECDFMKMEATINDSTHIIRRVDLADLLNERKFIT